MNSTVISPLILDTDLLSSFLWVNRFDIVLSLYPNIIIPESVNLELQKVDRLKIRLINICKQNNSIKFEDINMSSSDGNLFLELTSLPKITSNLIGDGEAAAIVLTIKHSGILGSNNFKDVARYIKYYHLKSTTTADILCEALNKGLIDLVTGDIIWSDMLKCRRILPAKSLSLYIEKQV